MRTPFAFGSRRRSGFTLVELLVVMSLIIILSTMAILIVPGLKDKQGVSRAADQFQGWLLISKQRAIRDQAPRGIRISQDATGAYNVVQYIEQPDDYTPNGTLSLTPIANNASSTNSLSTGTPSTFTIDTGLVQAGDVIQLTEGSTRQVYKISSATGTAIQLVSNVQSAESLRLTRSTEMPVPLLPTFNFVNTSTVKQFRVIRGLRPMSGEATQQLPVSVVLNIRNNIPAPPAMPTQPPFSVPGLSDVQFAAGVPFDIVFMPSGQLQNATSGQVILRLDPGVNVSGASTLIVIYARTGAIASHPISDGTDAFQFIRDGQDSGL